MNYTVMISTTNGRNGMVVKNNTSKKIIAERGDLFKSVFKGNRKQCINILNKILKED